MGLSVPFETCKFDEAPLTGRLSNFAVRATIRTTHCPLIRRPAIGDRLWSVSIQTLPCINDPVHALPRYPKHQSHLSRNTAFSPLNVRCIRIRDVGPHSTLCRDCYSHSQHTRTDHLTLMHHAHVSCDAMYSLACAITS